MLLQPATRVGPYEILASIGAGGMGEVYRARDTRLDRTVAIKILPSGIAARPETRQRFEREARAVSSLNHPHICALHDIGQQDGIDYLVMEYVEGDTLAVRLRKGALPLEQALNYAIQIADALDQAHRRSVVHRDLKPGNVMINRSGAKLLDFGLAKLGKSRAAAAAGHTAVTQTAPITREGSIIGTFEYMSPEQLEGAEADARSDIFAFGAVVYEMLTGHRAFEGKTQASLISAIMTGQLAPVSQLQPLASPALDRLVGKCLAKDPEERWQCARDLEAELKWIAEGGGAVVQVAAPASVARIRKRERLGWIVIAGSVIALAMVIAMTYLRPAPESPVVRFEVRPPDLAGPEYLGVPSVSPDGQYVAFAKGGIGPWRIWLHSLKSLVTSPLPGTESVQPFKLSWSPDSREIAFSTGSALKKVSVTGGTPQLICNVAGNDIAWNRDGVILFGGNPNQPVFRVAAKGGEPKALTRLDQSRQEIRHSFVQFLPDGKRYIYLATSTKPENSATYLRSLDSPEVKRIHDGSGNALYAPPGYLFFLRDAALMAQRFNVRKAELSGDSIVVADSVDSVMFGSPFGLFSVSENGVLTYVPGSGIRRTQLQWFNRSGERLATLGDPADYSTPAISPDQKMVALARRDPETKTRDIWVIDLQRGTSSRFTFDPADDMNPIWSPDGTRIAFSSDRKGHRDIYMKPASGVGEERLLAQSEDDKSVEDWSADGQYLTYGDDTSDYEWLFSFRGQKSVPLLHANFTPDQCRFSPNRDGPPRWIAYCSRETGARQVYVRSFAGALSGAGGKWQISNNGGSQPQWRGDGKELFYMNGNKLMGVEVNADGESFQAGIPKELFETHVPPGQPRNHYVVTSDGKSFLFNTLSEEPERESFTVVLNWPALLKH